MNTAIDIRPIRTDEDHKAALAAIESLWDAEEGTEAYDDLDVLTTLVEAYEARRWPIAEADPVEAIETAIASGEHSRAELATMIGQSRASEVLSRVRPLTLNMIRIIHHRWQLPLEALVRDYRLVVKPKAGRGRKRA